MSNVEHPKYEVISSANNIEVREYAPMIVAEVEVAGERKQAISDGFRLLADYIFGNNTIQQKIAMTAPVQQQASQKIAMTAPVQQQEENGIWKVSFVMPSEYTMQTLPKPNNNSVTLKEIPAQQFIVIKFSGMNSAENIAQYEKRLMQYIKENNIETTGSPKYAFYNPPWTLPSMRRNEIMLEIKQ
ncbi:MAG: heme-binding protein [Gammaproteobacteria bacterium]